MTDRSLEPRQARALASTQSFSLGVLVIALYAVFVVALTMGFGAYIIRTTWVPTPISTQQSGAEAAQQRGSVAASLDQLIFLIEREENLETAIIKARTRLRQIERDLATAGQTHVKSAQTRDTASGLLEAAQQRARDRLSLIRANLETRDDATDAQFASLAGGASMPALDQIQVTLAALDDRVGPPAPDLQKRRVELEEVQRDLLLAQEGHRLALAAHDVASLRLESLTNERDDVTAAIDRLSQEFEGVSGRIEPDHPGRARYEAIRSMFLGGVLLALVATPTILLTLLVTIFAGALGTVTSFSRSFLSSTGSKADRVGIGRLFVSIGEGVAAAVAIFLLAGAGMLVLTQSTGGPTSIDLSPYTVAFLAFVSGFMASDAFTRIEEAGANLFRSREENAEPERGQAEREQAGNT